MKLTQILFYLFAPLFALPQTKELRLPLTFHNGNGAFEYNNFPVKWNDTSIYFKNTYPEVKGVPSKLTNIKRGIICFDLAQYIYQNYIDGKINKENLTEIKNIWGKDFNEKALVRNVIKCFVNVISATDENNDTICLIDTNNNFDFSDETPFMPLEDSLPDKELNKQLRKIKCQRVLNGKVINDTVPLLIVKNGSYFCFSIAQYATVSLKTGKKNYQLAVCPLYFHSRNWKQSQMVLITDSLETKKAGADLLIDNEGFITVGNAIYKFIGVYISKNSLSLQKMSSSNQYSSQIGFRAPPFKSANLLTENEVSLAAQKGKYILIDFWGSWCVPCREQLPELKALYQTIDTSKFVLISIASSDNLDDLKRFIAKENMLWPQIFSDKITEQYHVNGFPTSFLINPNGIIVARDLSMDELKGKLSELALLKDD